MATPFLLLEVLLDTPTVVREEVELVRVRLKGGVTLMEGMGREGREEVTTREAMVEVVREVGIMVGARGAVADTRGAMVGARGAMAGNRGSREAMEGTWVAMVVVGSGDVTWLAMVEEGVEEVEVEEVVAWVAGSEGAASWSLAALAATCRARRAASRRRSAGVRRRRGPLGGPGGWCWSCWWSWY